MLGFDFKHDVDLGHFLTVVTLIAGFLWWFFTTIRSWRQRAEEEAKSGSLRLFLKLLREGSPDGMNLNALFEKFQSDDLAELRRAYCGKNWTFKNFQRFEGAVYRLDWEGKISFISPHVIAFRTDRQYDAWKRFHPTKDDIDQMIALVSEADDTRAAQRTASAVAASRRG